MLTISAVLSNYNHARYLPESIGALIEQSYPPIEIIVVDDASTDGSWEVLAKIKEQFPKIQLLRNEKNLGPYATALRGIAIAKGTFLALCAADDFFFPFAFEEYAKIVSDTDPDIALCCSDPVYFSEPQPYHFRQIPLLKTKGILTPKEVFSNCRKRSFFIFSTGTLYNKKILLKYHFDESLKCFSDFYLNCQMALNHSVAYVPKGLAGFRIVDGSYSQISKRNFRVRMGYCKNFFRKLDTECKETRKKFKDSGILSWGGYFFLVFLLLHPRYWFFFPSMALRVAKMKWKRFLTTRTMEISTRNG